MALTVCFFPGLYARKNPPIFHQRFNPYPSSIKTLSKSAPPPVLCSSEPSAPNLRTCKICKSQFDPLLNHPRACRFHTAHFGGETKRKFESVYAGGTMDTPGSGKVSQYWHCCGSENPFDPGCTAAPHASYDD
ncbi:hypothetical protein HRI_002222500 [Hibiscus trionum]|uniref:Carboxypeptidase n=1 Tax=Hibiscus trionum TaxID=183268 RepID=A0A9W7M118_HIBTR|nr:hypothetical protein HRI_002222500 [Hibiscus trionum]